MKTIFELATPRAEVLQGDLREDMFAARLRDVMEQTADDIYKLPNRFFENTFPTDGLQTLLQEVLGRLTGQAPANNPITRPETSFGGGKTHSLIALYHAVNGQVDPAGLPFIDDSWQLPQPGEVDVAGVVGSDLDPSAGLSHPADNITTYTLWGELAYQLGRRAGYALAEESDRNKVAAGPALFEKIIGDRPTLIMIDEIARHLRAAVGTPTATGKSNLAEQTVAFLMSLLEFAASQQRVVVVLTMAGETDAFAKETSELHNTLAEALAVSARQERVLTPAGENEIAAIVVHRLFKQVDHAAAQAVIDRYGAYYQDLETRGAHVHDRALRADYLQEFAASYPFHPELIRVLNLKVSTIPNFQRTRGALRLLAAAVRQIWTTKPEQTWLIHPHHIDLVHPQIIADLTSRLDRPKFKQVCEADIVSPQLGIPAHAAEADQPLVASGKPAYARRAGTTIFLHSLTQGIASGVELPELMLAAVTPTETDGDDPTAMMRSLERLYDTAWFLEYDGYKYRFKTEPSLNKIVDDETGAIGPLKAKHEIDRRIRKIWRKGFLQPVPFPAAPVDLNDDAGKPKLAIMHYDAIKVDAAATEPPDLVRKLYEHVGALESFRIYQNNVMFLVADADQVEQMVKVTRRYLAINRITGSADRMREFHKEHQKQLKEMGQAAELDVRVAITRAYRYLFYPTGDAPKSKAYLRRETVPPQDQGDTDVDQTNVVVRVLHSLKKVRTADDDPLPAQYLHAKAWDKNQVQMSTEDLRRAFARKIGLPLLLDMNQLKRSIESGVKAGVWLYYSAQEDFAYDRQSPPAMWQIGDNTYLYTPAEAARLKLRIKGKWQPAPIDGGSEEIEADDEPPEAELEEIIGQAHPRQVKGTGVPAQAFQQLLDQCQEHEVAGLRRLQLAFQGIDKGRATDLAAIGLSIPQMGKADFGIKLNLIIQFDEQADKYLKLDFQGDWKHYKRLKQITDAFAREGSQVNVVEFRLVIDTVEREACQQHGLDPGQLPVGGIVGVVELVEVIPLTETDYDNRRPEHLAGRSFREGLHGWVMQDPQRLPQLVPARGRMSLFNVDIDPIVSSMGAGSEVASSTVASSRAAGNKEQGTTDKGQITPHASRITPSAHPSLTPDFPFELIVNPTPNGQSTTSYALTLRQQIVHPPEAQQTFYGSHPATMTAVVTLGGDSLRAVSDHVLEAIREAGYKATDLSSNRRAPFRLPEAVGVRLGLVFLSVKPLSKLNRIEAISHGIRQMTLEEAYYWYSKCTATDTAERAQKALRVLLAAE